MMFSYRCGSVGAASGRTLEQTTRILQVSAIVFVTMLGIHRKQLAGEELGWIMKGLE
jgi:hypothetical protein